jgi:hypothetical protein
LLVRATNIFDCLKELGTLHTHSQAIKFETSVLERQEESKTSVTIRRRPSWLKPTARVPSGSNLKANRARCIKRLSSSFTLSGKEKKKQE